MLRLGLGVCAVLASAFVLTPGTSHACWITTTAYLQYEIDGSIEDTVPPDKPSVGAHLYHIGGNCGLALVVVPEGLDDRTPADDLGWEVEITSGRLPGDPTFPARAIQPKYENEIHLYWGDEMARPERWETRVRVRAVDRAGNISEWSDEVGISIREEYVPVDATGRGGCSIGGATTGCGIWALLALLALRRGTGSPNKRWASGLE